MSLSATEPRERARREAIVERFVAAARAAAATVERVERTAEQIAEAVRRVAPDARRIVVAEARDIPDQFFDSSRQLPGVIRERTRHAMATADVGITGAFAAVANTGTVCVRVDAGMSGYASLLARTHVVLVPAERIVERPGELFRRDCLNGEGLHADFVFITGPSATADMGPLVRGVHGPHHLHIIVI